jgi:hypothetical protein
MTTENEKLKTLEADLDKAWADYLKVKRPTHQVRNCPSDLDAEIYALQKYQAKQSAYAKAVREANL